MEIAQQNVHLHKWETRVALVVRTLQPFECKLPVATIRISLRYLIGAAICVSTINWRSAPSDSATLPPHWITRSARLSISGGIVIPTSSAVFRFTISS